MTAPRCTRVHHGPRHARCILEDGHEGSCEFNGKDVFVDTPIIQNIGTLVYQGPAEVAMKWPELQTILLLPDEKKEALGIGDEVTVLVMKKE